MREILFRGKRTDNGEWVEGYYSNLGGNSPRILKENIFIGKRGRVLEYENIKIIPETRGEFTGLTDKDGVKIFEGDIVKTHYANAQKSNFIEQVVFHNGRFCAYFNTQSCKQWASLYDGTEHLPQDKSVYMDSVEVIGNKWDNPELLEGGDK